MSVCKKGGDPVRLQMTWMLLVGLLLVVDTQGYPAEPSEKEEAAVAEIMNLGGWPVGRTARPSTRR
jgi:hypothetical protein